MTTTSSWKFMGQCGRIFDSFESGCIDYINDNCPNWNKSENPTTYMLPPIYLCEFTEPIGKANGAAQVLKPDAIAKIKKDNAEGLIYRRLEEFGRKNSEPMIIMQGFKCDDQKLKLLQHICPSLKKTFEIDFMIWHKTFGQIAIEVKGCDEFTGARRIRSANAEACDQLNIDQEVVRTLATQWSPENKNISVERVVAFPFLKAEEVWKMCSTAEHNGFFYIFAEDVENESNFSSWICALLEKKTDRSNPFYQSLLPIAIGLWSMELYIPWKSHVDVPAEGKFTARSSLPTAVLTQYRNVVEHRIIEPSRKLVGNLVRVNKVEALNNKAFKLYFLTPHQRTIWNGGAMQLLCGPAGTGKTILIMGKALQLARAGQPLAVVAPSPMSAKYRQFFIDNEVDSVTTVFSPDEMLQHFSQIESFLTNNKQQILSQLKDVFLGSLKMLHHQWCAYIENNSDNYATEDEMIRFLTKLPVNVDQLFSYLRRSLHQSMCVLNAEARAPIPTLTAYFHDRHVFIDDALTIDKHVLLWALVLSLQNLDPYRTPKRYIWIAYDPLQLLFADTDVLKLWLGSEILCNDSAPWSRDLNAAAKLAMEKVRPQWTDNSIRPLNIKLDLRNKDESIHDVYKVSDTWSVDVMNICQVILFAFHISLLTGISIMERQSPLDTVMRCSKPIYNKWKEFMNNTIGESEALLIPELAAGFTAKIGHQLMGTTVVIRNVNIKKFVAEEKLETVLAKPAVLDRQESPSNDEDDYVARIVAALIEKELEQLLFLPSSDHQSRSLNASDVAILMDKATCGDMLDKIRQTIKKYSTSRLTIEACSTEHTDALWIDFVQNAVSFEWPVVMYIYDGRQSVLNSYGDLTNYPTIVDYFAVSRCMVHLIPIEIDYEENET